MRISPVTVSLVLMIGLMSSTSQAQQVRNQQPDPSRVAGENVKQREERKQEAQEQTAKWNVRVDAQMVAMPEESALKLLPEFQSSDAAQIEKAFATVQQMITEKRATLIGWPMLFTQSGQRAVTETMKEERYPTEYSPDQAPQNAIGQTGAKTGERQPIVSAFETRNVGVTLEASATVLDNGDRIIVDAVPQQVELLGFKKHGTGTTPTGETYVIDQPEFFTTKSTISLCLRNGERVLIGVHKLIQPEGQIELVTLRAVASPMDDHRR